MKKSKVYVDVGCMLAMLVGIGFVIYSTIKPDGACFVYGAMLFSCGVLVNSLVVLNEINKDLDSIKGELDSLTKKLKEYHDRL